MEVAQTIDDALYQYYTVENNLPVPNWRQIKDPDWWIQYLKDMDLTQGIDSAIIYYTIINSTSWTTNPIHQSGIGNDT